MAAVVHEQATVESVAGDRAVVRIRPARPEVCRRCKACGTAGAGGTYRLTLRAEGLKPGDQVTLVVPLPDPWWAIGLVLALPLAALVAGAVVGAESETVRRWLGLEGDLAAAVLGVGGALIALGIAAAVERLLRRRPRLAGEARG